VTLHARSSSARYAVAVGALLLVTSCDTDSGDRAGQAPAPTGTAPASASADTAGTPGPLTEAERAWVLDAEVLILRVGQAQDGPTGGNLTDAQARAQAKALRSCRTGLADLGDAPTARLAPAHTLFASVCRRYDQAAACYITIAEAPEVVSRRQARKLTEAADCVTAAATEGATKLIDLTEMLSSLKTTGR